MPSASQSRTDPPGSVLRALVARGWLPSLLAAIAFLVYWPSLNSDFVYDARIEVLTEGFITSIWNLPAVLLFKVLKMHLLLGSRPGQLIFMMLNAAVWGRSPWGYHLSSNLLHAVNVALLFVLLRRLAAGEMAKPARRERWKIHLAVAAVTLIFALHPIATETVSAIGYSSDLLVAFFTLLALLAGTTFHTEMDLHHPMLVGRLGTFCAFAAVTCKESGIAAALILIIYWLLYRRNDSRELWYWFLGAATTVAVVFLAARFLLAPPGQEVLSYPGGSFSQAISIQPRLWVFMLAKLVWPVQLSADYTLQNLGGLSTPAAVGILLVVAALQGWLAMKSRLGALGVALFWLGLAAVSNFVPLNCIVADRYYYLPMAGVAMQLLAVLLMTVRRPVAFELALVSLFVAAIPLTMLTIGRQQVFTDEFALWQETLRVSPDSVKACNGLGLALDDQGRTDEAIAQYQKALAINPGFFETYGNFGIALAHKGRLDQAMEEFRKAVAINPYFAAGYYNLGRILLQKGGVDEAIADNHQALQLNPTYAEAHNNLGIALAQEGKLDEAIREFQAALKINRDYAEAHSNLGYALALSGRIEEAVAQLQEVVRIEPNDANARKSLQKAQSMAQQEAGP